MNKDFDKKKLLNLIALETLHMLKEYDFKIFIELEKLNRFKKTEIQTNFALKLKDKIKKLIHTYENEKYVKEKADKFGYLEKFVEIKTEKIYIKKKALLNEYISLLERLNIINQELYNHTEFYENKYMIDYNHELFNIFKNKLGYYTKLINKIKEEMKNP